MGLNSRLSLEKSFGLLSLATLGMIAIACVPNVKTESTGATIKANKQAENQIKTTVQVADSMDLEVETVREINKLNSRAMTASSFDEEVGPEGTK